MAESSSGVTEERVDFAVAILSDVWDLIFNQLVTSPADLQACFETCRSFRHILKGRQASFFIPTLFVHLEPYLSTSDILHCRQVCRSWKTEVDSFLQSDDFHLHSQQHAATNQRRGAWLKSLYEFTSLDSVNKFYQYKKEVKNFPLITKHITVDDRELVDLENHYSASKRFWSEVGILLGCHADEIQHLILKPQVISQICFIQEFLLTVCHPEFPFRALTSIEISLEERFLVDDEYLSATARSQLKTFLKPCRIRPLGKGVVQLKLKNLPEIFIQELLDAWSSSSVRTLVLRPQLWSRSRLDLTSLPKLYEALEELSIYVPDMQCLKTLSPKESNLEEYLTTVDLPSSELRLTDLRIKVMIGTAILEDGSPVTFQEVFAMVNTFSKTLRKLSLRFVGEGGMDAENVASNLWRLKLPHLEDLHLLGRPGIYVTSLDFLEYLHELKELTLGQFSWNLEALNKRAEWSGIQAMIKFVGFETRMEVSNIWKVVPKLERVVFKDTQRNVTWKFNRPQAPVVIPISSDQLPMTSRAKPKPKKTSRRRKKSQNF